MVKYFFKTLLFLAVLMAAPATYAQKGTFEVKAPKVVAVGEVFHIEYVTGSKPKSFLGPQFEGMDVLAGPTLSTSKSVAIVNGHMSQEAQYAYTYVLQCNSEGEFTVSEAKLEAEGDTYTVRPFKIRALTEEGVSPSAVQSRNSGGSVSNTPRTTLAQNDIVIRAVVDKKDVYKGEPIKVTYKLYRRVPLNLENAKFPSYNGFWVQQLNVDGYQVQREELNGKIYDTHVLREDLLFPQQAGTLTIEPLNLSVVAQIITQQRRQSIIDDFLSGPDVKEVRRKLSTQPVKINVRELPAGAPSSFFGAVGDFQMETIQPPVEVAANSAFTYGIKVSGKGNLPQVQAPKLTLPSSFEQYNVKTTESLNNTSGGIYGYRQFEYPVIARVEGEYNIEPIEFTYFNPKLRTYETLKTPPLTLRVLPDSTSTGGSSAAILGGLSKEDIKIIGNDIRFIRLDNPHLRPAGNMFFGGVWYFLAMAAILILFVFLFVWFRKLAKERRNSALLKGRKANKVALQRFRIAEEHMKANNQRGFYEEMLKGLWGYIGDKLNIPASNLTKENVREELVKRGVAVDASQRYIDIIVECEYAQYSPDGTGMMNDVYASGVEIVSKLEGIIGR